MNPLACVELVELEDLVADQPGQVARARRAARSAGPSRGRGPCRRARSPCRRPRAGRRRSAARPARSSLAAHVGRRSRGRGSRPARAVPSHGEVPSGLESTSRDDRPEIAVVGDRIAPTRRSRSTTAAPVAVSKTVQLAGSRSCTSRSRWTVSPPSEEPCESTQTERCGSSQSPPLRVVPRWSRRRLRQRRPARRVVAEERRLLAEAEDPQLERRGRRACAGPVMKRHSPGRRSRSLLRVGDRRR